MNTFVSEYKSKLKTADEAVRVVKSGDIVDYSFCLNFPYLLDEALAKRKDELSNILVRGGMLLQGYIKIIDADPKGEVFSFNSWHFTGYERKLYSKGLCSYIPMTYHNVPSYYRRYLDVDVAFLPVSPMNNKGYFSVGLTNSATRAICEKAKYVILEVNEKMPFVLGDGARNVIHISEADCIVEGPHPELPEVPVPPATETDAIIADSIVERIPDGATIQLGIGGMPNVIGDHLAESDIKDLGCHTEMIADPYLKLWQHGKLTNKRKTTHKGLSVWNLALGSHELYEWLDMNKEAASYPVDHVNDPGIIAETENLISINNAMQIDLFGQINAESNGPVNISGTGGQLDFLMGAYAGKGSASYICMSSTFTSKDGTVHSRILPTLSPGSIITDPRSLVQNVCTEYGIVNLSGLSTWQRAEAIISIAHPKFRDELIKEAQKMNIWRRSNK